MGQSFRFRHHFVDDNLPGDRWGQTALVDIDRDGDLDFITGQSGGEIRWYECQKPEKWVSHLLGTESPSDVGGVALDVNRDGSSGPVLALGFWLREQTGMNEFYNVMAIYLPLLLMGHDSPIDASVEWWVVDVFGTVGPG